MPKLIFLLTALFFGTFIKAQYSVTERVNAAKFQIVKATVEFLATDVETFGNNAKTKCEECSDYTSVKQFIKDNKLTKADILVDTWEKIPIDTATEHWKASLNYFKDQVVSKITSGEQREKRKTIKGYNGYLARINFIIIEAEPGGKEAVLAQDSTIPVNDSLENTSVTTRQTTTLMQNSLFTSVLTGSLCGIAALLLYLLYSAKSKNKEIEKRKAHYKAKAEKLEKEIKSGKENISELTIQNEKLKNELKEAKIEIKFLDDYKRSTEKKQNEPVAGQSIELPIIIENTKVPKVARQPKAPVSAIKYARYADMGDGFSNSELLDKSNNETIFELTITQANTGTFAIINDPGPQKYALANSNYFLEPTCQYDSFPSGESSIITDKAGIIKLTGNKWTITQPAKISFG